MKTTILFFLFILGLSIQSIAGTLQGAWEMLPENNTSNERAVMIATQNYLSIAVFEKNVYIRTYGGLYEINNNGLTLTLEFNDKHPESVGTKITYKYIRNGNTFSIENLAKTTWKRIDTGLETLAGNWRITAREGQDGKMYEMVRGARKTLKICSETRFQWMAINPETKEFTGTGGGTYTLKDGKYTETIEFFSRDNNRVGASLGFDAKVENNKWQHSGKSSKGDKVNEIWVKEN
ncbi:membrane or secreted protein [Emticicia sp. SJ17W-69]|uniref:membrane or secreted protein n=1 Tax=Emticicia sp. SJ17W-69 TaxID=3421657 RepID=UPI003EBBCDEF